MTPRKIIFIGPGRSGTSLAAGYCFWLGLPMGNNLIPARSYNQRGVFEDEPFLTMNRMALEGHISNEIRDAYFQRYVTQRNAQSPLVWGLKEPRLTQSLEYLLPFLGDDVRIVLMGRSRDDVIGSYLNCGWGDYNDAVAWYEMHITGLQRQLKLFGGPVLRVPFPDFVERDAELLQSIEDFVFDGLDRPTPDQRQRARQFILPSLANRWKRTQGAQVMISTPTTGNIRAETVNWRESVMRELGNHVVIDTVIDRRPLQHARNEQVLRLMRSGCSHLFLLDADCVPKPGTIQRLLSHKKPIVTAPHPTRIDGYTFLVVMDQSPDGAGYVVRSPLEGMEGPDVRVGCAGLMIAREVFLKMQPPWFEFRYDERGLLDKGEDFDFCEKALELGYEVWADCTIPQNHNCAEWF